MYLEGEGEHEPWRCWRGRNGDGVPRMRVEEGKEKVKGKGVECEGERGCVSEGGRAEGREGKGVKREGTGGVKCEVLWFL